MQRSCWTSSPAATCSVNRPHHPDELNERCFSYPSSIWGQLSWCTSVTAVAVKMMDLDQFIPTEDLDSAEWGTGLHQVCAMSMVNLHCFPRLLWGSIYQYPCAVLMENSSPVNTSLKPHLAPPGAGAGAGWVHRAVGSSMKCPECLQHSRLWAQPSRAMHLSEHTDTRVNIPPTAAIWDLKC